MLKTILTAVLILGASSAFASEFDGNLQNRYPQATSHVLVSKPVALPTHAPALDIAGQTFGGGY
jgi:hypothetical protein